MIMAAFVCKIPEKQTTLFSCCLEIGTDLKIPCKIFTKVPLLLCIISLQPPIGDGIFRLWLKDLLHARSSLQLVSPQFNWVT